MSTGETKKNGRPTGYTAELADEICASRSSGDSLAKWCAASDKRPTPVTVYRWLREYEEFRENYILATEDRADLFADEIIEIADDSGLDYDCDDNGNVKVKGEVIKRAALRIDARKWAASRFANKKYGNRIENSHTGPGGNPLTIRWANEVDAVSFISGDVENEESNKD